MGQFNVPVEYGEFQVEKDIDQPEMTLALLQVNSAIKSVKQLRKFLASGHDLLVGTDSDTRLCKSLAHGRQCTCCEGPSAVAS